MAIIPDFQVVKSNPIIRHKFTADPTALVFHNTLYLYTGHDEAPVGTEKYIMKDWLCFSPEDMEEWREHPVPLKATDFSWAKGDAYASKVIAHDNRFYWFAAVTPKEGEGKAKAVAVSDQFHTAYASEEELPFRSMQRAIPKGTILTDSPSRYLLSNRNAKKISLPNRPKKDMPN